MFNNVFGNLFGNTFKQKAPQQQTIGGAPQLQSSIPGYNFAPYQIKAGDTFESIGKQNGLSTSQIQQANNNMLIPPPKGSNINLPLGNQGTPDFTDIQQGAPFMNYQQALQSGQVKPQGITGKPPVGYGPQAFNQGFQAVPTNQAAYPSYSPLGLPFSQATAQDNDIALGNVTASLQSGTLPPAISLYAFNNLVNQATGQKFTHQDMVENGYSFNPATGAYTLGGGGIGAPNATGPNGQPLTAAQGGTTAFSQTAAAQMYAANNTPFMQQRRWDPKAKKFVKIGDLVRQGRLDLKTGRMYDQPKKRNKKGKLVNANQEGGGGFAPQPAPLSYGTSSTPSNVIGSNIGGG